MTLKDAYGRPLTNLRIAVTRECNYNCFFCHIEGDPAGRPAKVGLSPPLLKPRDYYIVGLAAARLGIDAFKITGGEPLVRQDIVDIVSSLRLAEASADISMTTNGYLLGRYAEKLAEAGLNRVNVSLHSMNREHYKAITGVDGLDHVLYGIDEALRSGLRIKVNMTVTSINANDVWDVISYASSKGLSVQLIELQPVNEGKVSFSNMHVSLARIERELLNMGAKVMYRELHNRPIYKLPDGTTVEVVKPFDNPLFCAGCMRVRLLSDGRLTPCINYVGPGVSIVSAIRQRDEEAAVKGVMEAIIKVNTHRRPYYMWRIDMTGSVRLDHNEDTRLVIPKRASKVS